MSHRVRNLSASLGAALLLVSGLAATVSATPRAGSTAPRVTGLDPTRRRHLGLIAFAAALSTTALLFAARSASATGVVSVPSLAASQGVAQAATPDTGFAQPYAGTPKYEKYAPTQATNSHQVNQRLG